MPDHQIVQPGFKVPDMRMKRGRTSLSFYIFQVHIPATCTRARVSGLSGNRISDLSTTTDGVAEGSNIHCSIPEGPKILNEERLSDKMWLWVIRISL
jgi:hypothetical protein